MNHLSFFSLGICVCVCMCCCCYFFSPVTFLSDKYIDCLNTFVLRLLFELPFFEVFWRVFFPRNHGTAEIIIVGVLPLFNSIESNKSFKDDNKKKMWKIIQSETFSFRMRNIFIPLPYCTEYFHPSFIQTKWIGSFYNCSLLQQKKKVFSCDNYVFCVNMLSERKIAPHADRIFSVTA